MLNGLENFFQGKPKVITRLGIIWKIIS